MRGSHTLIIQATMGSIDGARSMNQTRGFALEGEVHVKVSDM